MLKAKKTSTTRKREIVQSSDEEDNGEAVTAASEDPATSDADALGEEEMDDEEEDTEEKAVASKRYIESECIVLWLNEILARNGQFHESMMSILKADGKLARRRCFTSHKFRCLI